MVANLYGLPRELTHIHDLMGILQVLVFVRHFRRRYRGKVPFSCVNSPEPKALVSYCHSAPSVVRRCRPRRPSSVNFHILNFFSRTTWWILMKPGRDEVLMVPDKCCRFSTRSASEIISLGPPSSKNFFRPKGFSDKPKA